MSQSRSVSPCASCARLDGEASAVEPHGALRHWASSAAQTDDLDAGTIRDYVCEQCGARLRRYCGAYSLDGWLLLQARQAAHRVAGG